MNKTRVCERWLIFLCEWFVFAVPIAFLIAYNLAYFWDQKHPPLRPTTPDIDRLAGSIIVKELAQRFCVIETGCFFCLAVFLFYAIKFFRAGDRASFRKAMLFLVVTGLVTFFVYLGTLVPVYK